MKTALKSNDFLVVDDFLDEQSFEYVWRFIEEERFRFVHDQRWIKAFRLADGQPLWGDVYTSVPAPSDRTSATKSYPTTRGIDSLIEKINAEATRFEEYIGASNIDWNYFFCRPYIYPTGSGLSWHTDGRGDVHGAYIYYAHRKWLPHWGAELLIDGSNNKNLDYPEHDMFDGTRKQLGMHLDWGPASQAVMEYGVGHYILPKPNRFVLIRPGILHRINPVHQSAGDEVRVSIIGFFLSFSSESSSP